MPVHHHLLLAQLKHHFGDVSAIPTDLMPLLKAVDAICVQLDREPIGNPAAPEPPPGEVMAILADQDQKGVSWQQFSLVFEAAHDGLIVLAHDGSVLACNSSAKRMLGASRDEIETRGGVHPWQFIDEHGDQIASHEMPSAVVARTGLPVIDRVIGVVRSSLQTLWVSVTAVPIPDPMPGKTGLVISLCDVTAAKLAQAAQRAVEIRIAGIVETSLDAIVAIDDQHSIVLFNPAAERMFKCDAAAALGRTLDRFIPQRFRSGHADYVRGYSETGRTARAMGQGIRLFGLRADGEEFALEATISGFTVGQRGFFTATLRDIGERIRAESALRESEEKFKAVFNHNPLVMTLRSFPGGRLLDVNAAGPATFGYTREEALNSGWNDFDIWPAADIERFRRMLETDGQVKEFETVMRRRSGDTISALVSARLIEAAGKTYCLGLMRDITESKRSEQALRMSESRYRRLFDRSMAGVYQTTLDGRILDCNSAFAAMLGYDSPEDLIRKPAVSLYSTQADREVFLRDIQQAKRLVNVEFSGRRKDGSHFIGLESVEFVDDSGGEPFLLGTVIDITERKRSQDELTRLMTQDTVTGLRRYVSVRGDVDALLASAKPQTALAFLYIDLDHFRTVNEAMGYEAGDFALHTCAQRLRFCVDNAGCVSRPGGDEFVVVLPNISECDPLENAERIRATIEQPIAYGAYQIQVTCSIGISRFPQHGSNATELLQAADAATSNAKQRGRNCISEFSLAQAAALRDRLNLGRLLHDADIPNEMVLHYQPLIHARTGRVTGFEALVRWNSRALGLLPPGRFIKVAEDLGLIVELGKWVLEEACRQIRRWQSQGHSDFFVSVNVSAQQLNQTYFAGQVDGILKQAGVPPGMLELELTESALIDNVESTIEIMHALKKIGVRLALDDFGTGFSSLNHLKRLPLDKLKIDQAFVRELVVNPNDAAIIRAIIAMGHQLQLTVTAEGVETEAQLGYLRRNHCDDVQGMLLSAPLPADQLDDVIRARCLQRGVFDATQPARDLLILDDEENVLRALVRLLRADGYRIHTATTVTQAFEILGRNEIQVIISDERMPDARGTEFLSKIKDMYPNTIRIVLSGYTELSSVTEAVNRGAIYKFLTKPWVDAELREQIAAAFRAHSERAS